MRNCYLAIDEENRLNLFGEVGEVGVEIWPTDRAIVEPPDANQGRAVVGDIR